MSNSSLAIDSGRAGAAEHARQSGHSRSRSQGVDSFRGPYHEEVSTITISAPRLQVRIEVRGVAQRLRAAGTERQRAGLQARFHARTREVDQASRRDRRPVPDGDRARSTGQYLGHRLAARDWAQFNGARNPEADAQKAKPVVVPRPETNPATTKDEHGKIATTRANDFPPRTSGATPPVGQLIGGFQQQMERMLAEVADAAVREKAARFSTTSAPDCGTKPSKILAEASSSQADRWMDELLKRMNQVGEESARARHAQWTKKIEGDLQQALARMEARQRELEALSEKLTTNARERLEGAVETARKDSVGRIVARLKEQSAPVIDEARKVAAELTKREEELGKICEQLVEKSSVEIEEACTRLDRQFEMILRERLDSAREELERAAKDAAKIALNGIRVSAVQQETESQARLHARAGAGDGKRSCVAEGKGVGNIAPVRQRNKPL